MDKPAKLVTLVVERILDFGNLEVSTNECFVIVYNSCIHKYITILYEYIVSSDTIINIESVQLSKSRKVFFRLSESDARRARLVHFEN